jgi:hypothetical protein
MLKLECFIIAIGILSVQSCTRDKFETDPCSEVSFSQTIRPIINLKCAVAGCHVSGFQPGDFTQDEVLEKKVTDGKLQLVVFDLNIMPPVVKLTREEKSVLKCWMENGAKSN